MERAFAVGSVAAAPQVVVVPKSLPAVVSQKASVTSSSFHITSGAAVSACALALAAGGRASTGKRRLARGHALRRSAVGTIATGQRVQWNGVAGAVKFVGKVSFASGEWIGVQLDEPKGMHDGTVFNESYFSCPPKHGVFCQPADLGLAGSAPAAAAPAPVATPAAASPMGATSGAAAVGPDKHGVFCMLSELGGGSAPAPAAAAAPAYAAAPASTPMAAAASPATSFSVGQKVSWNGTPGTVQFVGAVAFAAEPMVGVQLDAPSGMHDGSLFGKTYFSCPDKHGVFCKPSDLQ